MDEFKIKEAFAMVREDINLLNEEINSLRNQLGEMAEILQNISAHKSDFKAVPTHNPADNLPFTPLKPQTLGISTGNNGVPADRQAGRQTDRHIISNEKMSEKSLLNALEVLNSLDIAKREIRLKFKRLTDQEFLIFSTIYQLGEETELVDYKKVAEKLSLSESSIRDYVSKLIKKGVPVEKTKANNKNVYLSISENLKKIAPLSTILHLRDI